MKPTAYFLVLAILLSVLSGCVLPFRGDAQPDPERAAQSQPGKQKTIPTPTPFPTQTPVPSPTPLPNLAGGYHDLLNGDWENARIDYQKAFDQAADNSAKAAALLGLGRAAFSSGNYAEALTHLRALLDTYPDSPNLAQANFLLGQTYAALQRYPEANEAFGKYLALRPGWIDATVHELRGDIFDKMGDFAGARQEYQAAWEAPQTGARIDLQVKLANATAHTGDYATALVMYDDLFNRADDAYTKAQMRLFKGQALVAQGSQDEAFKAYLDAVENYPQAYDSYTALVELVNAGYPVGYLQRGIVDYYAAQYGASFSALERFINSGSGTADEIAAAHYFRGLVLEGRGENVLAVPEWDKVIQEHPGSPYYVDAWSHKLSVYTGDPAKYTRAIETANEYIKKHPQDQHAPEFLTSAARAAERGGDLATAAQLWERVAVEYPLYEGAMRTTFLAAITRYRMGQPAEANSDLQRALGMTAALNERAAILFWMGKAQRAVKNEEAAKSTWQQAALIDPSGYYSLRARQLLEGDQAARQDPLAPPPAYTLDYDRNAERLGAELWLKDKFKLPADTDLNGPGPLLEDKRLWRGTELWGLGLYDQANAEFADLQTAVQNDPAATYRLAVYLNDLGSYNISILAARRVLDLAGLDDAGTLSAPRYFNRLRFGTYYSDLFLPAALEYGFNPLFLFAVARQESMFEGLGRSHAGARGLMQIIPDTGENIAAQLGWPPNYAADDLYRPAVNVKFGTFYLAKMREYTDGDLYAALAAYNGGPGNAQAWKALAPDDPDLFLESIRYEETRNYIRNIYEMYEIYVQLYEKQPE